MSVWNELCYFCHCIHLKSIGNQFEYGSGAWVVEKAKSLDGFATDTSGFANIRTADAADAGGCGDENMAPPT